MEEVYVTVSFIIIFTVIFLGPTKRKRHQIEHKLQDL